MGGITAEKISSQVTDEMKSSLLSRIKMTRQGKTLDNEDAAELLMGLALRISDREVLNIVNARLQAKGLKLQDATTITYYKRQYSDLIDEIWAQGMMRIGEIYCFADKFHRIHKLNKLALALEMKMNKYLEFGYDDTTHKVINTWMRVLTKMQEETGFFTVKDVQNKLKEQGPTDNIDTDEKIPLTKQELIDLMAGRFQNQLPKAKEIEAKNIDANKEKVENAEEVIAHGIQETGNSSIVAEANNDAAGKTGS